ncbi:MAG: VOC family protein [Mycobacterium kyogaense]|uniref:VOC family protein n=1 Tax=Mycobacterium kyogaense TaxID=2212479 RepID=UPI002FFCF381
MSLDVAMITFDCSNPDALAAWWADAVGGRVNAEAPGEFVMVARDNGPMLGFQRVPDPTPGKNRVHLDLHTTDKEAEVTRLVGLGARETGRHSIAAFDWVVLADPEGNAFCIVGG